MPPGRSIPGGGGGGTWLPVSLAGRGCTGQTSREVVGPCFGAQRQCPLLAPLGTCSGQGEGLAAGACPSVGGGCALNKQGEPSGVPAAWIPGRPDRRAGGSLPEPSVAAPAPAPASAPTPPQSRHAIPAQPQARVTATSPAPRLQAGHVLAGSAEWSPRGRWCQSRGRERSGPRPPRGCLPSAKRL